MRLKSFTICILLAMLGLSAFAQSPDWESVRYQNNYYLSVTFNELPTEKLRASMSNIEWLSYQGGSTFLCAIPVDELSEIVSSSKSISALIPNQKISAELEQMMVDEKDRATYDVVVSYASDISSEEALRAFTVYGASEASNFGLLPKNALAVNADAQVIESIRALPFVFFIEMMLDEEDFQPINYESVSMSNTHYVRNSSLGYTGAGVTIGIGDGGMLGDHIDMDDRILYTTTGNQPNFGDHGDHVTGIAAGAGNIDPRMEGTAPNSDLVIEQVGLINYYLMDYYNDYGMVVTNNSYGNNSFDCNSMGVYTNAAKSIDDEIKNFGDVSIVFAAGNNGGGTCPPFPQGYTTVLRHQQSAKNVITVGNMKKTGGISSGSSRGPVKDGRLKPEVCAVGSSVRSTLRNYDYNQKTGTSMAAPSITGIVAMLHESHRALYGGNVPSDVAKALVCNTAEDQGTPGPDFIYGFGLVNAKRAIEAMENHHFLSDEISHAEVNSHTISNIPSNVKGIKVMLYWNDEPSDPSTSGPRLVNDLDLRVSQSGNSTVYLPLILDPSAANVANQAQQGVDQLNNIEQVVFSTTATSSVIITVDGSSVPFGPQRYVVSYEFITDDLEITYPIANEKWVPGEVETIRWDQEYAPGVTYMLEYSSNNGASWLGVANAVSGSSYNWTVASGITSQAKFRITGTDGSQSVSDAFTIINVPQNLDFDCGTFTWDAVPGAIGYEVYILDGAYMEPVATVTGTSYAITYNNGASEDWISVAAILPGGEEGRRAIAIEYNEDLFCPNPSNAQAQVYYDLVGNRYIYFTWSPVTSISVSGYYLQLIKNDPDCCPGDQLSTQSIYVTSNYYLYPLTTLNCCFSWQIITDCEKSSCLSHGTTKQCMDACLDEIKPDRGKSDIAGFDAVSLNNDQELIQIIPNPSQGDINLQINAADGMDMSIDIFSIDGRLIQQIPSTHYESGDHRKVWSTQSPSEAGTYIVIFHTVSGTMQKQVVITR